MGIENNLLRYVFAVLALSSVLTPMLVAQNAGSQVSSQLVSLCRGIKAVIGILVIVLLALGALLYAVSHVLPASGNVKGNLQGWALNMVVGAAVALLIYFIAPWLAIQIIQAGNAGLPGTQGNLPTSFNC